MLEFDEHGVRLDELNEMVNRHEKEYKKLLKNVGLDKFKPKLEPVMNLYA